MRPAVCSGSRSFRAVAADCLPQTPRTASFTRIFRPKARQDSCSQSFMQPPQREENSPGRAVDREPSTSRPKCFLIVHSVAKKHNVGNLLRSATAFGVEEVFLIGSRQFTTFGSHGAGEFIRMRNFANLSTCCDHLRQVEGCKIVGVEIMDSAKPIHHHPFTGPTAFIFGNEGSGLSDSQIKQCDSFVYIPQYGEGTASLNVYVAASIVMHHFGLWAGYAERSRTGTKYDVGERPVRSTARGMVPLTGKELAAEQERRRLRREGDAMQPPPAESNLDSEP